MNEKSCGAIIIYNNKVLVIKQKQGFYGFPKGHVIEGESEIETALREVKEEVNLDVVIDESKRYSINYITDKNINKTVVFFLAHPISFDLKIQEEELKKAQWVDIEDVSSILTHQDLRDLFINICNDMKQELKESIEKNYNLDIVDITKSSESTVKNVYIISTKNKKYVAKIYNNDLYRSMIKIIEDIKDNFYVPNIIKTINNKFYMKIYNYHLILYDFLLGTQLEQTKITKGIIKEIACTLRLFHNYTSKNIYDVEEVKIDNINLDRKSLLHFDLTKGNIFYYNKKIGLIDFDDARYGISVMDVAIILVHLFCSKKNGINEEGIKIFLNYYYEDKILMEKEIKYIKNLSVRWIDDVMKQSLPISTIESLDIKKNLILNFDFVKLMSE